MSARDVSWTPRHNLGTSCTCERVSVYRILTDQRCSYKCLKNFHWGLKNWLKKRTLGLIRTILEWLDKCASCFTAYTKITLSSPIKPEPIVINAYSSAGVATLLTLLIVTTHPLCVWVVTSRLILIGSHRHHGWLAQSLHARFERWVRWNVWKRNEREVRYEYR